MITDRYQKIVTVFLVVAVLLGFAAIALSAIYQTFDQTETPVFNATRIYIANILTSLVGGIVALGFGQAPAASNNQDGNGKFARQTLALGKMLSPRLNAPQLPSTGSPKSDKAQKILGVAYALVYIFLGIAAIITWWLDDNPPDLIKNLATVALGLIVPIVAGFFPPPGQPIEKVSNVKLNSPVNA